MFSRPTWRRKGKSALIKGEELVGIYDTEIEAVRAGYQRFGNVQPRGVVAFLQLHRSGSLCLGSRPSGLRWSLERAHQRPVAAGQETRPTALRDRLRRHWCANHCCKPRNCGEVANQVGKCCPHQHTGCYSSSHVPTAGERAAKGRARDPVKSRGLGSHKRPRRSREDLLVRERAPGHVLDSRDVPSAGSLRQRVLRWRPSQLEVKLRMLS